MTAPVRFYSETLRLDAFAQAIDINGYAIVEGVFSPEFINELKPQLEQAIAKEASFHGSNSYKDYGMLVACPLYGGAFLEVANSQPLMAPFNHMLQETCIIYVYTSSSMPPNATNYSARIHVDRPHYIPGYTEALGCLILLDDFTEENGATWVLPGSHTQKEQPDEVFFYKNAERIIAPAGSVFYFHLRLWHAGGQNNTNNWRHALGIGMVRGYMKQRIDLPRALDKVDLSGLTDLGLQKLGFFSQPPTSLEEFYAPPEKRSYRQKSEWALKQ